MKHLLLLPILLLALNSSSQTLKSDQPDLCDWVEVKKDKFSGTVEKRTPSYLHPVSFSIYKNKLYISLTTIGHVASVNDKGVYILLENGTKITKINEDIDVDVNDGNYEYSAFFEVTPNDLKKLLASPITDFKLFVFEENDIDGKLYQALLKCLLSKK